MIINEFLDKMKEMETKILNYIRCYDNIEENYQNMINLFTEQNVKDKKHNIKLLLNLISKITNHHNRTKDFLKKIEKILLYFKNEIVQFSSFELFNIFKKTFVSY